MMAGMPLSGQGPPGQGLAVGECAPACTIEFPVSARVEAPRPTVAPLAARVDEWFSQEQDQGTSRTTLAILGGAIGAVLVGAVGWIVESNSEACQDATGTCGQRGALIGGAIGAGFGVAVGLLVPRGDSGDGAVANPGAEGQ